MARRTFPPDDYAFFAQLPIKTILGSAGGQPLAFHLAGNLDDVRTPLICLADYCRNMADYGAFLNQFYHHGEKDWPVVLIDLAGHGRSGDRKKPEQYSTTNDARDVNDIAGALGIEQAILLGQGYGGQVAMALGAANSHLIAGTILIDSAPVVHAPGLVRMRDNLTMMGDMRGKKQFFNIARQVFGKAHPGATEDELDSIISRIFMWSKSSRAKPIFDPALLQRLQDIHYDDVFEPQWALFNMLRHAPMMLMRTQLSDQLSRTTFERMANLRTDAVQLAIPGQGSPALLSGADEVGAIVDFVGHASQRAKRKAIVWG